MVQGPGMLRSCCQALQGDCLRVLLDQCSFVVAGAKQPDVLHVVAGLGHDVDHIRAVGSGQRVWLCPMLNAASGTRVPAARPQFSSIALTLCSMKASGAKALWKIRWSCLWARNHEADTKYGQRRGPLPAGTGAPSWDYSRVGLVGWTSLVWSFLNLKRCLATKGMSIDCQIRAAPGSFQYAVKKNRAL